MRTHRDIVLTIEVREGLGVRLVLNQLLRSSVKQANVLGSLLVCALSAALNQPDLRGLHARPPRRSAPESTGAHRERQDVEDYKTNRINDTAYPRTVRHY